MRVEDPRTASVERLGRLWTLLGLVVMSLCLGISAVACSDATSPDEAVAGEVETESSEGPPAPTASPPAQPRAAPRLRQARVARVIDGDTLETVDGRRIRLVQIDTPESDGECYGAEATAALETLLPPGSWIGLERDPRLDDVDRYGRLLRYVYRGGRNVNIVLVRRGAASVWFFDGDRGRYADRLLAEARAAQARKRGAWGACRARLDPSSGFQTSTKALQPVLESDCMSGYSPCLPVTGDLDCANVRALRRAPVVITGDDPYRLDGDDDGYGCE